MTTRLLNHKPLICRLFICSLLVAIGFGCDVHEFPAEEPPAVNPLRSVELRLAFDHSLPVLGEYDYDTRARSRSAIDEASKPHDVRYTINIYPIDRGDSRSSDSVFTFVRPIAEKLDTTLIIDMPKRDYRIVVWADYVDCGTTSDKYYRTSDFAEVVLNNANGHPGSNNFRDAYYGESTVGAPMAADEPAKTVLVNLKRPMAKYTFITNDLREFLDKQVKAKIGSKASEAALDDYSVRFIYTQYMPCSFNVHTGKPADSRLGVEYRSLISMLDDDKAQMAFDYVFTNGSETSVSVAMEVLHSDGSVVARIPQFDVPLKRSHHTIVTGKFLTTKSGGDIGIKTEFDGEFNIEIK